ncbi:MAG: hypothetical protein H0U52_06785 [Chloroflexi bacterium]|nr:hypothetical protein [Chloroflexota bacterium]
MPRHFRVREGRTITLPQGIYAGPGATNMRLDPGAVVTIEDAQATSHARYITGRLRAEDWEELDHAPAETEPQPVSVPAPGTRRIGMAVNPIDDKKER